MAWHANGKPRQYWLFEDMKKQAQFETVIWKCKHEKYKIIANALAKGLMGQDINSFWKSVRSLNQTKIPKANSINGCSGEIEIAEMWKVPLK